MKDFEVYIRNFLQFYFQYYFSQLMFAQHKEGIQLNVHNFEDILLHVLQQN